MIYWRNLHERNPPHEINRYFYTLGIATVMGASAGGHLAGDCCRPHQGATSHRRAVESNHPNHSCRGAKEPSERWQDPRRLCCIYAKARGDGGKGASRSAKPHKGNAGSTTNAH